MKKDKKEFIPQAVIERLPMYYQELQAMKSEYISVTSSDKMAQRMDVTPEQIRKDFSYFGALGHKGVGYIVEEVLKQLEDILGVNKSWRLAIAGLGNVGKALVNYENLSEAGFKVIDAFDRNSEIINTEYKSIPVYDITKIKEHLLLNPVDIVAITVKGEVAQTVVDDVITAGVKGIWLFSPVRIDVPDEVSVVRADLLQSITVLSYYLNNKA